MCPSVRMQVSPRAARPMCGSMDRRPRRSRRAAAPQPCVAMPAPAQGPHCKLATGSPWQQGSFYVSMLAMRRRLQ